MELYDQKFDFRDERNLSLVMDFYELTMSQCYFNSKTKDKIAVSYTHLDEYKRQLLALPGA